MVVDDEVDDVFETGGDSSAGYHGMSGDDGGIFVKAVDKRDHVFGKLVGDTKGVFVAGFGEIAPEFFDGSSELSSATRS